MKLSIVNIISATTLGLFAAAEVATAVSAVGYEKKVIASSFSSIEEAIAIAGLKLAIECKTKLDNLSDQEIDSKLKMLEVEKKSLEDPLVILFANKGKNLLSEDCSGTDKEGFSSMISSVMSEYDIRLSEDKKNGKDMSKDQFYAAFKHENSYTPLEDLATHLECEKQVEMKKETMPITKRKPTPAPMKQPIPPPLSPEPQEIFVLENVEFVFDSFTRVKDAATISELNEFGARLKKKPPRKITIVGHTDSVGSNEYNNDLSIKRANAVMKHLVIRFGLDPKTISTSGRGELEPTDSNDSYQGRQRNRRVEFNIWWD